MLITNITIILHVGNYFIDPFIPFTRLAFHSDLSENVHEVVVEGADRECKGSSAW